MNLAYVAGLVDGEGSIGFTKSRSAYIPRISITNTNLELLQDLKQKFGGHIQRLIRTKDGWKPAYAWIIQNSSAVAFAESIEKWLRLKYEQVWLVSIYDAIRPGYGHKWTPELLEAVGLLKAQSNWLNWRGSNRPAIEPITAELPIAYSEKRRAGKK